MALWIGCGAKRGDTASRNEIPQEEDAGDGGGVAEVPFYCTSFFFLPAFVYFFFLFFSVSPLLSF